MEKKMIEEMKQLDMINEEIAALEYNANLDTNEVIFPFPMEGKFREEYIQTYLYYKRYKFVKLEDTVVIPPNLEEDDTFDNRLKNIKDVDIELLIEKCRRYLFFQIPFFFS
jgi:hypothetical protein